MGAASVNLLHRGLFRPHVEWKVQAMTGSGTDVWKFSEAVRAGEMSMKIHVRRIRDVSQSRHCMTMGTASTMACITEAMGMCLPHNGALPAVDARRQALAHMTGIRIVQMVKEDLKPPTF